MGKFIHTLIRRKIAIPQFSRSRLLGTKAAIFKNRTGYPLPNLNEHVKRVDTTESVKISKQIFADLSPISA